MLRASLKIIQGGGGVGGFYYGYRLKMNQEAKLLQTTNDAFVNDDNRGKKLTGTAFLDECDKTRPQIQERLMATGDMPMHKLTSVVEPVVKETFGIMSEVLKNKLDVS